VTRRIVLKLSGMAKFGMLSAMTGIALALWARDDGPLWARAAGAVLLFGGAALYAIARLRAWRRPRD